MTRYLIFSILLSCTITSNAQKYMTRNGYIGFYSHTPLEDIKADNNQVAAALDLATNEIVFQVNIRSFHFERSLMEEHFNENYMESEKFPKATLKGKVTDPVKIDPTKKGSIDVTVSGDMTIKDVTKPVTAKGTMEITDDGITASSKFNITPEDYNITIPGVVREKIAKSFEVTVSIKFTTQLKNSK